MAVKKYYEENMKYTPEQIALIEKNENLIYAVWSSLTSNWIKKSYRNELISAGWKALCYAAQLWDPNRGDFGVYAGIYIKGLMYAEIRKIVRQTEKLRSLDEPVYNEDGGDEEEFLGDRIPSKEDVEERALEKETAEELRKIMYKTCNKNEISVIEMFCNQFMNYTDIAKAKGISKQRVFQLINNARQKILEKYEKGLDKRGNIVL